MAWGDVKSTMLEIAVAQIRYALESDDLTPALRTTLTTARSALNEARRGASDEGATLWRCRECGKWSHAKRDPRRHKRWHSAERYDGTLADAGVGWFEWCGPFDRWTATHDDPSPRGYVFGIGQPVSYAEKQRALGEYQPASIGEVPF